MTIDEQREAARQFYQKWVNRGKEDEDDFLGVEVLPGRMR